MIRPSWTPTTPDHHRLIAAVVKAAKAWRDADENLWAAFAKAREGGVALNYVAEEADVPRATVYRHLPKDEEAEK